LEGAPKNYYNVDMIPFTFHINDGLTFGEVREMAGGPLYRFLRCRYKTFFGLPSGVCEGLFAVARFTESRRTLSFCGRMRLGCSFAGLG
jgi:hypothetical protein